MARRHGTGEDLVEGTARPGWWRWRGFIALFLLLAGLQGGIALLRLALRRTDPTTLSIALLVLGFLGAWAFAVTWSRAIVRGAGFMPKKQPWWSERFELALRRAFLRISGRPPGKTWYQWALMAHYRAQALDYLERAAREHWPDAHFELGLILEQGEWGLGGRQASGRHYLAAAQRGHGEAAYRLAEALRWGTSGAKNPEGARRWYLQSARLGFGPAMAWLAQALETGDGLEADPEKAAEWRARLESQPIGTTLRQPAPMGFQGSQTAGPGLWLREALDESTQALADLPGFESSARGFTWFLCFAIPLVLLSAIGYLFLSGGIIGAVSTIPAITSLVGLTLLHFHQRRHMRTSRKGRRTETAARQGDPEACHRLGLSFLKGDSDHPADTVAARHWFLQAAQQGHLDAMAELGELLAWGVGGPKDMPQGHAWLDRAAAAGHEGARLKRSRMAAPEHEESAEPMS